MGDESGWWQGLNKEGLAMNRKDRHTLLMLFSILIFVIGFAAGNTSSNTRTWTGTVNTPPAQAALTLSSCMPATFTVDTGQVVQGTCSWTSSGVSGSHNLQIRVTRTGLVPTDLIVVIGGTTINPTGSGDTLTYSAGVDATVAGSIVVQITFNTAGTYAGADQIV